jgi:hypothetical protein
MWAPSKKKFHFVELYSEFENDIRELSLFVGAPECPNHISDNDIEIIYYH